MTRLALSVVSVDGVNVTLNEHELPMATGPEPEPVQVLADDVETTKSLGFVPPEIARLLTVKVAVLGARLLTVTVLGADVTLWV